MSNNPQPSRDYASELRALANAGGEICQDDYEFATHTGIYAESVVVCDGCGNQIENPTDENCVTVMYPPICDWQREGNTYHFHPHCHKDDGADAAENRAFAFDPGYQTVDE